MAQKTSVWANSTTNLRLSVLCKLRPITLSKTTKSSAIFHYRPDRPDPYYAQSTFNPVESLYWTGYYTRSLSLFKQDKACFSLLCVWFYVIKEMVHMAWRAPSSYGCIWEVGRTLKELLSLSAMASTNSYAFFMLSQLPACIHRVMDAFGKLEEHSRSFSLSAITSTNSYDFFMLSQLPACIHNSMGHVKPWTIS